MQKWGERTPKVLGKMPGEANSLDGTGIGSGVGPEQGIDLGPLTVPIFTAGAIAGQVRTAEAAQQEAFFRYQQVIQVAFREVDDALVDQHRTQEELASLTQQVETLREYVTLARLRYDEGYASYLEVTYAENLLYEAQVRRIEVQGTNASSVRQPLQGHGDWRLKHRLLAPRNSPMRVS